MYSPAPEQSFPKWSLLPKKDTGITSFLTKNPTYDGRGVTVAILDSGIDPGAPGLQFTSEGKVKIIERYDCSGCGDVNTSTIAQMKEDRTFIGLTGRQLVIPAEWNNPTGIFHLGVKHAYDLYPDRVKDRLIGEWRERNWDACHKTAVAAANRQLVSLESVEPGAEIERFRKEDLEAQLEFLTAAEKKYQDVGPIYDCVLYHDGSKWMACIDTSEIGDLGSCPHLGEYSITHEYRALTQKDLLNISINVHDDGNILEIVSICSNHGTHVAAITAAHFSDAPDMNGIAPGAQIVSLTIGDGRLISMETGTALVRAMIKVAELCESRTNAVHVINMSYGEHAHWSNTGRVGELMSDLVNRYSVVFVVSAGNQGPALSTISCPPDISQDSLIGVGAYVSTEMMDAEYSMRKRVSPAPYTWSSRGPTFSGAAGVSLCAPGGAVAPVPNCTLRGAELQNGTSMASPHVAGAVAVLLSACMAPIDTERVQYSPYSVKRALENGCIHLHEADPFAQGCGLLNIEHSWKLICQYADVPERDVRFHISCACSMNGRQSMRGIYLRSPSIARDHHQHDVMVAVEPHFLNDDSRPIDSATKIGLALHLHLVCDAPFVSCPRFLYLANAARNFSVRVDTRDMEPGVYYTMIRAYDNSAMFKGPLFRVPVTVIVPRELQPPYMDSQTNVHFDSGTIHRQFYTIPERATYAVLRVRESIQSAQKNKQRCKGMFVLHSLQAVPRQRCRALEMHRVFYVTSGIEATHPIQVRGGLVLELVLAKYWANVGSQQLDWSLSFHGAMPLNNAPTMHAADGIFHMEVANLQGDELAPVATLKTAVQILKPADAKIQPLLASRDIIQPGRQIYELLLTYNFHLNKTTEITPNSPLFSDFLYESEFESQLWMMFDNNKQYLGAGDAYPTKYCIKLDKGDYYIRMQVRHDKKEMLDKLTETPMLLNQKLSSNIIVDVCGTHTQAITGSKKNIVVSALIPTITPLYIAPLTTDKLFGKNCNIANYFTGSISFVKDEFGKKVDTYPFKYIAGDVSKCKSTPTGGNIGTGKEIASKDREKSKVDELAEAVRDLKVQWLPKLTDTAHARGLAEQTYRELIAESDVQTGSLTGPIHSAYLQCLHPMEARRQLPPLVSTRDDEASLLSEDDVHIILDVCESVLLTGLEKADQVSAEQTAARIDADIDSLLAHFAIKNDTRPDATQIKQIMDRKRNVFLDCLCRKGMMLCRLHLIQGENCMEGTKQNIDRVWAQVLKLSDPGDRNASAAVVYFAAWHAFTNSHNGRLLKQLIRVQEDKAIREVDEKIIYVLELLQWEHLVTSYKRSLPSKYPPAYKPI